MGITTQRRHNPITINAVIADVPSALILSTLTMEAICYSETSVLLTATRRHIPADSRVLPASRLPLSDTNLLSVNLAERSLR
jgi:hypothetical protein